MLSTPYFLIDGRSMDALIDDMLASLHARWKEGIVGYSLKTNNLPWIIRHVREKGLWAEEFIDAAENGAIINIDSKRELQWLRDNIQSVKMCKVGLRVNFCLEDFCPGESQCGKEDGRFGFSYECGELRDALLYLREIG